MDGTSPAPPSLARTIRRNTRLLTVAQGLLASSVPIVVAVGSPAAVRLTGRESALGLVMAVYFVAMATAAPIAGRWMDRTARRPGLVIGHTTVLVGACVAAASVAAGLAPGLFAAAGIIGGGAAMALLGRAAVADMYPPKRRARAIGATLAASTVGAVAGPPVVALVQTISDRLGADRLVTPWLLIPLFEVVAIAAVLAVRPDPRELAEILARGGHGITDARGRPVPADAGVPDEGEGATDHPEAVLGAETAFHAEAVLGAEVAFGAEAVDAEPADTEPLDTETAVRAVPGPLGSPGGPLPPRPRKGRELLALAPFRVGLLTAGIAQGTMVAVMTTAPVAVHAHGHGDVAASIVLSIHFVGMFALMPLIGVALDRWGRRRGMLAVAAIGVLGIPVGALGIGTTPTSVAMFCSGLSWAGGYLAASAVATDVAAAHERAGALGLADLVIALCAAGGGIVGGILLEVGGFSTVTILAGAAFLPVAVAVARLREPAPGRWELPGGTHAAPPGPGR